MSLAYAGPVRQQEEFSGRHHRARDGGDEPPFLERRGPPGRGHRLNIRTIEVVKSTARIEDGEIVEYQVQLKIGFEYEG
jgi:hypothetical protein